MLKLFTPNYYIHRYTALRPAFLKEQGIQLLICDIDNTLVPHDVAVPDDEAIAFLKSIQDAGIQIAVASNKYQAATQKLIDHYFPEIHFTAVFGQREGIKVKPDPTVVFDILEVAKVTKEEVLYVGDSGVDMQTAANARVTVCGVTWGFRPRAELEEFSPQYIVDTAEEIKRLIL